MGFFRAIIQGIKSLMLYPLRSMLTMLGIIFGVCSVIAMLAIGEGQKQKAEEEIKKLGAINIIITSQKPIAQEVQGHQVHRAHKGVARRVLPLAPGVLAHEACAIARHEDLAAVHSEDAVFGGGRVRGLRLGWQLLDGGGHHGRG